MLVAGDFNQDGNMDLAVNGTGFDVVAILLGDGQGGMTLKGHLPVDTLVKGLDVGDVNKDGHPDLVAATNWGYDEIVLLGDGVGSFHVASPPSEVDGDGEPVRILLRDFNNDGRLDILVNAPDDSSVVLYFGDGKGASITIANGVCRRTTIADTSNSSCSRRRRLARMRASIAGEAVAAQITVSNFLQVTSAQFTLAWDPTVLQYEGATGFGLGGVSEASFGALLAQSGNLAFSWDDGLGVTLADHSRLFTVTFKTIGPPGSVSALALVDSVTPCEVGINFAPAPFRALHGRVTVGVTNSSQLAP
jgi:hypothetical protein